MQEKWSTTSNWEVSNNEKSKTVAMFIAGYGNGNNRST